MSETGARAFLHPVTLEPIPHKTLPPIDLRQYDDDEWDLLTVVIFRDDDGQIYRAEPGERTDLASIPKPVRWLLSWSKSGSHNPAAVIHDDECTERVSPSSEVHARFGRMLEILPVNPIKRVLMHRAVQIGGPRFDGRPLHEGV